MANQFLVEIHDYISRQIEAGIEDQSDAQSRGDGDRTAFMEGKISELKNMRAFFSEHFNLITQKYF